MTNETNKYEVDLLSLFRFFAVFILLFHHCIQVYSNGIGEKSFLIIPGGVSMTWLINGSSTCGMWILYVLSGYLMGKIFLSNKYTLNFEGIKRFLFNRGLRILPQYWLYILILLVMGHFDLSDLTPLKRALSLTYSSGGPIPHLWSVSTEFQWYLSVPVFYLLLRKLTTKKAIFVYFGVIIAQLAVRLWGDCVHIDTYHPIFMNLDFFLCGFLLNIIHFAALEKRFSTLDIKVIFKYICYLSVGYYLFVSYITFYGSTVGKAVYVTLHSKLLPIASILYASVMILILETSTKEKKYATNSLWLARFDFAGALTYGIYLYHVQVRDFLNKIACLSDNRVLGFLFLVCGTLAISSLFAYVTHYGVDKHLAPFKK